MAHITFENLNVGWNLGFVVNHVRSVMKTLREWSRQRRAFRTIEAELQQYSSNEIAELGISHADIHFIAEDGTRTDTFAAPRTENCEKSQHPSRRDAEL